MKQMREENEYFRRAILQNKSTKWDKFRDQRAVVIDNYIKQKKKCMITAQFCKMVFLRQLMLQTLWDKFKEADQIYEQKLKGRYMNVVIANMWNRRRKRWGGDVFIINTNILRRNFSLFSYVQHDARYQRALQVVKPFLMENY